MVVESQSRPLVLPDATQALPGRDQEMMIVNAHFVNGHRMKGPYPDGAEKIYLGLGCFWGAERLYWNLDGVYVTAVGYQDGITPNPTYEEVCTGMTAHTETVLVVYEPSKISLEEILKVFWESHDPTQGMRQYGDIGTQYRSGIYTTTDAQLAIALASRDAYQAQLDKAGLNTITTDIHEAKPFYFAETYHQQYLEKNPNGYCGLKGTGVACAGAA